MSTIDPPMGGWPFLLEPAPVLTPCPDCMFSTIPCGKHSVPRIEPLPLSPPLPSFPAPATVSGWTCPKCRHVWAPWVYGCATCNSAAAVMKEWRDGFRAGFETMRRLAMQVCTDQAAADEGMSTNPRCSEEAERLVVFALRSMATDIGQLTEADIDSDHVPDGYWEKLQAAVAALPRLPADSPGPDPEPLL